jgi:hypothetical protein
MGHSPNPGPPLTPAPEFCPCEPPSGLDLLKAAGVALLVTVLGAAGWFGIVVLTGRFRSLTTVLIGLAAGWLIHRAAGRHRSRTLGFMGAGATVLAAAGGYALLWVPFLHHGAGRALTLYDLFMTGLSALVAYRLAGPGKNQPLAP